MSMQEHYGLNDQNYSALKKAGITDMDLLKMVPCFDPHNSGATLCKISLYYFVDKNGDWRKKPLWDEKKVAAAIFESLGLSNKEKLSLFEYIEDLEDGDE